MSGGVPEVVSLHALVHQVPCLCKQAMPLHIHSMLLVPCRSRPASTIAYLQSVALGCLYSIPHWGFQVVQSEQGLDLITAVMYSSCQAKFALDLVTAPIELAAALL